MPPAQKQSFRMGPVQWLGLALLALLLAIPLIHWAAEAGFSGKLERLRADLRPAATQGEFLRVAKSHGFECKAEAGPTTHVRCEWWEARYYDVLWIAKFMATGISAEANFTDGQKSG